MFFIQTTSKVDKADRIERQIFGICFSTRMSVNNQVGWCRMISESLKFPWNWVLVFLRGKPSMKNACLFILLNTSKKQTKTRHVIPVTPNDLLIPFGNLSFWSFHTKIQWAKALLPHQSPCEPFSSRWVRPIWKICGPSNCIISPTSEGKNHKSLANHHLIIRFTTPNNALQTSISLLPCLDSHGSAPLRCFQGHLSGNPFSLFWDMPRNIRWHAIDLKDVRICYESAKIDTLNYKVSPQKKQFFLVGDHKLHLEGLKYHLPIYKAIYTGYNSI